MQIWKDLLAAVSYVGIIGRRTHTGSTYSRCCHSDEDVVAGELVRLGGGALLGDAALLALEDGEGRHVECGGSNDVELGVDCIVNLVARGEVDEKSNKWE